jgi:hypothetical protein
MGDLTPVVRVTPVVCVWTDPRRVTPVVRPSCVIRATPLFVRLPQCKLMTPPPVRAQLKEFADGFDLLSR